MILSGLQRQVPEAAAQGPVVEELDSALAVGAVYRRLDARGVIAASD